MKIKSLAGAAAALTIAGVLFASPAFAEDGVDAPVVEATETATPTPAEETPVVETPVEATPEVTPTQEPATEDSPEPEFAPVDPTPFVLVAWKLPGTSTDPIWPGQTKSFSVDLESGSLDALDDQLLCGESYQIDLYHDSDVTTALLAAGTLNAPNDPAEDLAYDGVLGNPWKYVDSPACVVVVEEPPVTNAQCTTFADGGTSTNLNPNGWVSIDTRSAGHTEYVDGGLHVYTDDNSSQAKVSWAKGASFSLAQTGQLSLDYDATTGIKPGLQLYVTFASGQNGTLVYEDVYGQDLWLTNGSNAAVKAAAPSHTGGNGSENHGTIDEWLSVYPDAQVTGIGFSLGSGVLGDGVLHSLNVGCTTYSFDKEEVVVVVPPTETPTPTPTPTETPVAETPAPTATAAATVSEASAATPEGSLASTGANFGGLLASAALLLVLGGLVVGGIAWRQRKQG